MGCKRATQACLHCYIGELERGVMPQASAYGSTCRLLQLVAVLTHSWAPLGAALHEHSQRAALSTTAYTLHVGSTRTQTPLCVH